MTKTQLLTRSLKPTSALVGTAVLLATLAMSAPIFAAPADGGPVYTARFSDLAIGGYDAVAYFIDGAPAKGSSEFEVQHRGVTWRFASAANLTTFQQDPTKYSPQYGGYCAWAMAGGDKAAGKPPYWKIVDGKLYLNYSSGVQTKWLKDIEGFVKKADEHWAKLTH